MIDFFFVKNHINKKLSKIYVLLKAQNRKHSY